MKKIIATAVIILSGLTAFSQSNSKAKNSKEMEKQQIIQAITNIFNGADEHNWAKVQNAFADNVLLDFSSLSGSPATTLTSNQIIQSWKGFLPGFDKTNHHIFDFKVSVEGNNATAIYSGKADHFLGKESWSVEGTYESELTKNGNYWKVTEQKFNLAKQTGNTSLPSQATEVMKNKAIRKVEFMSEGLVLKGNLYLPENFSESKKYKVIIVTGSWTTVKEQMPDLYARQMANDGFIALTFDFRYYGESEGQPREYENPADKIKDIQNTVTYLTTLSFIDHNEIAGLGVCASSGYMSYAAAQDKRIKTIVLVAPWLHNAQLVEVIYGSRPDGVKGLIKKSEADSLQFATTGNSTYVLAASATDNNAAMYVPQGGFDYYLNPSKGAILQWKNNFSLMSWKPWLTFDGIAAAKQIEQPVYIIHSESGAVPQGVKQYYALLSGEKDIIWLNQYTQLDLYIVPQAVKDASDLAVKWLNKHLN